MSTVAANSTPARPASSGAYRLARLTALAVGPTLTLVLAQGALGGVLLDGERGALALVVMLVWSPFFFSVPALLMQDARDAALPGFRGVGGSLLRGALLLPYLLRPASRVKAEVVVSFLALLPVVQLSAVEVAGTLASVL